MLHVSADSEMYENTGQSFLIFRVTAQDKLLTESECTLKNRTSDRFAAKFLIAES